MFGTEFEEESRVLVEVFGKRWLYYVWKNFDAVTQERCFVQDEAAEGTAVPSEGSILPRQSTRGYSLGHNPRENHVNAGTEDVLLVLYNVSLLKEPRK